MDILPCETGIQKAAEILRSGGIVMHPTETCYGIACDLRNQHAVERLFGVKRRPFDQPVSALFADSTSAETYTLWSDKAHELAKNYLPGPLTLVLALRENSGLFPLPSGLAKDIGVRISSHPCAMELATLCGFPISTTSANMHGDANPYSVDDILAQFADADEKPDLILDGGSLPVAPPSTIVRIEGAEITILRQGNLIVE